VEEFDGLIILASNLKSNLDETFLRSLNQVNWLPAPDATAREQL